MGRRLVFYTHAFAGGGAEIVFARLAQAFAEAGDSVVFAADYAGGPLPVDSPRLRHVILGPGHATSTFRLAKILRQEKPQASFSALGAQNLKHILAAILTGRRAHCVLGYHGFAQAEPKRLSQLSYRLSPLITRLAGRTICVSDALLDDIADRWGGSRARMLRIYNPVPDVESDFAARDPDLVLALGRLIPIKRFTDLVEAFARLGRPSARLVILGDGPERATIQRRVDELGLGGRVRLAGHVGDPAAWYRTAACVAIASESESFGLTAAEALSHGLPVVTTDCLGPPELIGGDGCGTIVPVGDIEALAAALRSSLASPGNPAPRLARAAAFRLARVHRHYADLADSLG